MEVTAGFRLSSLSCALGPQHLITAIGREVKLFEPCRVFHI